MDAVDLQRGRLTGIALRGEDLVDAGQARSRSKLGVNVSVRARLEPLRGKLARLADLITERTGLPLSIGISAANTHDS
jgi:hypothetical protein